MSEFDLKESVGESKKISSKRNRKTDIFRVIVLILIYVSCYFGGYFEGKNSKIEETNNDVKVEENDSSLNEKEEFDDEDSTIYYEGFGVVVITDDYEKDEANLKIAKELYEYGTSALICNQFEYGEDDSDLYEIKNYSEVSAKFTSDNSVALLPGSDNFENFASAMGITEKNKKYYMQHQCDRGGHYGYSGTMLKLVSYNQNEMKLEAVSVYVYNDEDIAYAETITDEFIIRKENNEWKIAKISANQ